ncbi:MAG: RrF2 family transcriptional regulator [Oscillospiraceae bacterium]
MQLKITTDYAIRTILHLATTKRITSSAEVADAMGIPQKYLINTIGTIKRAGLVETYSGTHGGYALAKAPSDISLGDIIEVMEGTTKINRCLEEGHYCSRGAANDCPIRRVYAELQERIETYLKSISIDQLLSPDFQA